jgi:TrmH family RNA methyltransferase
MITSTANPKVKWVRALHAKRKAREEERLFVVEGIRLAREVVAAGVPTRLVLHTEGLDARGRGLANSLARLGAEVETVTDAVMAACSDTEAPQGLLAIASMPDLPLPSSPDLALVADGLADPGNLGTILRTALAAGVQAVYLTGNTVDPFNPKVVRAAMGAHFHLPLRLLAPEEVGPALAGLKAWVAEAAEGGRPYTSIDWRAPSAVIIGSEATGPERAIRTLAEGAIHIPMAPTAESLNAAIAAAIILFEVARQRGLP